MQSVFGLLAALLVKYPDMQHLAQRAFITYLRSIHKHGDKDIFDVTKLPIEEFSASLGLPMTPKIRFLNQKSRGKTTPKEVAPEQENANEGDVPILRKKASTVKTKENETQDDILHEKETQTDGGNLAENEVDVLATRVLKKKKLKINVHRPVGTRVVFDEEGNTLPPLAAIADPESGNGLLQHDKVKERYQNLMKEMRQTDKEDKVVLRQRLREKRTKEKMKLK